jgi:peptide-methionine (S)-S-oxide reductase
MPSSLHSSLFGALLFTLLAGGLVLYTPTLSSPTSPAASPPALDPAVSDTATFAGGCFWCMEPPYDAVEGVAATLSGFSGGTEVDPSYREVARGNTSHTEVVQVIYDSTQVSYERLLRIYWHNVDPFDGRGQFCDRGAQYRPAIFPHNARHRRLALQTRARVAERFDQEIAVAVVPFDAFYAAEQYHQNYYTKNPRRYKNYREGCGRDARLHEIWGEAAGTDAPLSSPQ